MKTLFFFCLFLSTSLFAKTLLLVGGGDRPQVAMEKFAKAAGGKDSYIVVIPWASKDNEGAQNIQRDLYHAGAGEAVIADDRIIFEQLSKATGVFFAGGDQNKLMSDMRALSAKETLKDMYHQGVAFAGTSAGTAIMSESMITGNGDLSVFDGSQIERAEGLGLLAPDILVDQHFTIRSRFNRLGSVILKNQFELGIGIDENNALYVTDDEIAEVFGPTEVFFIRALSGKKLTVEILRNGDKFNLKTRDEI